MELVSVIIPTFNRFDYLLNTIRSIQQQTYKNIEIIVVNDCSTQKEYYTNNWKDQKITIINLKENSKKKFGYACAGYVRNKGIEKSNGKYIAFCDDDDIWFPEKISLQINKMKKTGCLMSCTDGFIGNGIFNKNSHYKKYNAEHYFPTLYNIYENHQPNKIIRTINKLANLKPNNLLKDGFPNIWTLKLIKIHNCIITSSVVIDKAILTKINNFKTIKNGDEDYDCWLRALNYTNCTYLKEICFYYDLGHGDGQNY